MNMKVRLVHCPVTECTLPSMHLILELLGSMLCMCCFALMPSESVIAQPVPAHRLTKTQTNDFYAPILINNIFNYYSNAGDGSFNPNTPDDEGFEFPAGSGETIIFEDGLVWGCWQNGALKVGGSTYLHGLQAGKILSPGSSGVAPTADNPLLSKYRIYRVRPDINPSVLFTSVQSTLQTEASLMARFDGTTTAQSLYDQYIADWNAWPAADGAPFTDVNKNGSYDPSTDIPGVQGADQTLWHVSNDLDSSRVSKFDGTSPIGLEIQRTIWAFNRQDAFGNTIFLRYRIINESGVSLDSMFVAQWTDPDIGGAGNMDFAYDLVGCDSTRNLGFGYKSVAVDSTYGAGSPAIGTAFLQGPAVPGTATDSSMFDFKWRRGLKAMNASSLYRIVNGVATYADPPLGGPASQWHNILRGTLPKTGGPYLNPVTGQPTKFCVPGDPATGSGWVDGTDFAGSDRRMVVTSGPFSMAVGDTQEVIIVALVGRGADRFGSIAALKSEVDTLRSFYHGGLVDAVPSQMFGQPISFSLSQNYPNPFNPNTTIRYTITERGEVTLKIFDVLGREVAMLVNGQQEAGAHAVVFDAARLASGIYLYRLTSGSHTETKKLVLLK